MRGRCNEAATRLQRGCNLAATRLQPGCNLGGCYWCRLHDEIPQTVRWQSPSEGARSLDVEIPAGVDSGMNLRLNGEGGACAGLDPATSGWCAPRLVLSAPRDVAGSKLDLAEDGPAGRGSLYISVAVREHAIFERDGSDIHVKVRWRAWSKRPPAMRTFPCVLDDVAPCTLIRHLLMCKVRLTVAEAILGSSVIIPTLSGNVSLRVPPGTRTGDRRVMTGRGVQTRRAQGHQFVHFEVVIPRQLSEAQRELVEALKAAEDPLGDEERTRRS